MISLHADHVDASGAYGQKFAVVEELVNKGLLTEIPEEFRDTGAPVQENVPVVTTSQTVVADEFDMTNGHADHVDETGRYARAYEEKFGAGSLSESSNSQQEEQAGSSWKSFLQKIIAEEKSKLKV
jgi:hypothetical protein